MTNDVPERIWVWRNAPHGDLVVSGPDVPRLTVSSEYIRKDLSDAAARDAQVRAEARQVKPLEWWRSDTGDLFCDTLVGRYQIQKGRERYFMMPAMIPGRRNRPDGDAKPSWHKAKESAKAAAQDDYERRVLSALIPADQEGDQ